MAFTNSIRAKVLLHGTNGTPIPHSLPLLEPMRDKTFDGCRQLLAIAAPLCTTSIAFSNRQILQFIGQKVEAAHARHHFRPAIPFICFVIAVAV